MECLSNLRFIVDYEIFFIFICYLDGCVALCGIEIAWAICDLAKNERS